jgi:hypothetical protein
MPTRRWSRAFWFASRDRRGDGRAINGDGLSHRVRSCCVAVGYSDRGVSVKAVSLPLSAALRTMPELAAGSTRSRMTHNRHRARKSIWGGSGGQSACYRCNAFLLERNSIAICAR